MTLSSWLTSVDPEASAAVEDGKAKNIYVLDQSR
jgi:hypothetical protein